MATDAPAVMRSRQSMWNGVKSPPPSYLDGKNLLRNDSQFTTHWLNWTTAVQLRWSMMGRNIAGRGACAGASFVAANMYVRAAGSRGGVAPNDR